MKLLKYCFTVKTRLVILLQLICRVRRSFMGQNLYALTIKFTVFWNMCNFFLIIALLWQPSTLIFHHCSFGNPLADFVCLILLLSWKRKNYEPRTSSHGQNIMHHSRVIYFRPVSFIVTCIKQVKKSQFTFHLHINTNFKFWREGWKSLENVLSFYAWKM